MIGEPAQSDNVSPEWRIGSMIKRLEITHVHTTPDPAIQKYIRRKIGGLDRYIARQARASAHAEVKLKQDKSSTGNSASCEVTLYLPEEAINVSESTVNHYAAVDIVEMKLKQQVARYKERRTAASLRHRLAHRFSRKSIANV